MSYTRMAPSRCALRRVPFSLVEFQQCIHIFKLAGYRYLSVFGHTLNIAQRLFVFLSVPQKARQAPSVRANAA